MKVLQYQIKSYKEFKDYKKGMPIYVYDYTKEVCSRLLTIKEAVEKANRIDKYGMWEISLNKEMQWY